PCAGAVRSSVSDTGLLPVSIKVKSGALAPARGAPEDDGSCRATINIRNAKAPKISTVKPARMGPRAFPRYNSERRNARRIPTARKPAAKAKRSRLTHAKLRVRGKSAEKKK